MRRGTLGTAAALAAALALPTPALATTWTVDPSHGAGCTAQTCGSISDAAAASSDGDAVQVDPGTYSESPTFTVPVTLRANGPGDVTVRGTIAFSFPAGPASP